MKRFLLVFYVSLCFLFFSETLRSPTKPNWVLTVLFLSVSNTGFFFFFLQLSKLRKYPCLKWAILGDSCTVRSRGRPNPKKNIGLYAIPFSQQKYIKILRCPKFPKSPNPSHRDKQIRWRNEINLKLKVTIYRPLELVT